MFVLNISIDIIKSQNIISLFDPSIIFELGQSHMYINIVRSVTFHW